MAATAQTPTRSREIDSSVFGNVRLKNEKDYYNRLLDSLVDINTKRLDSLKKSFALGQTQVGITPKGPALRNRDDNDDVLGLIFALVKKDSSSSETSDLDSSEEQSLLRQELEPAEVAALRSSWCKSTGRKASKLCKKACKQAVKSGCSGYHCNSHLKKKIRKSCKEKCNSQFGVDTDKDSE